MDNKTKKQRYFDKLKADPVRLAAYHEKERQRVNNLQRKQREELKGRPDLQKKLRKQETLRKRKQRERKKVGLSDPSIIQNSELGSFKRPQSLGKALNKLKKNLPKSPSKKQAVVRKLINEFPELLHSSKKSLFRKKVLSDEDRQIVANFYCREDISYQAPGKRDTKSVKDPETKKRKLLQKRYLVISVKDLYQQFIEETNLRHIKKTTFYNLRPKNVLLVSDIPHTVQPAPTKKRLHYQDVYSSSEYEVDASCTSRDGVDASYVSQDSNESDISKLQNLDYLNAVTNGSFIEVEITSEKGLKHNYFAIFKEKVESEELLVTVEFLKQCTKKDKLFTLDEKSASFKSNISIKQIVRILDQPDIVTKGERIYYKFSEELFL